MSCTLFDITRRLSQCLVFLFVTAGFVFQSWEVMIEYFKFTTTTNIEIKDFPKKMTPPMLVLCARMRATVFREQETLSNIFSGPGNVLNDSNDAWKVKSGVTPEGELNYTSRKYLTHSKYCMYVRVRNVFTRADLLSPRLESKVLGLPYFYKVVWGTQPFFSYGTSNRTEMGCRARVAYFQVLSTFLYILLNCSHDGRSYRKRQTSTIRRTHLLST